MKYNLNPFRWLLYFINRYRYRHSRWLHYYASIPYTKGYILKKFKEAFRNTKINGIPMSKFYGARINETPNTQTNIQ